MEQSKSLKHVVCSWLVKSVPDIAKKGFFCRGVLKQELINSILMQIVRTFADLQL
jgi:hypothetical protein